VNHALLLTPGRGEVLLAIQESNHLRVCLASASASLGAGFTGARAGRVMVRLVLAVMLLTRLRNVVQGVQAETQACGS